MTNINVVKVELVKDKALKHEGSRQIRCAADAANILQEYLKNVDRMHFVVMMLSTKHYVNAIHTVSFGTLETSNVHPRETFKSAILANSSAIIVGHNHLSGDPTLDEVDVTLTKRLVEAGKLLGIEVLDHIVIGDEGRFVSLKAEGRM